MDKALQKFNFNEKAVHVIMHNGEPWWIAKDVCNVLEISKHRDAVSRLDREEKGSAKLDTLGGTQEMTIVSESGLYSLIFRSNKPEAKKFKRWVTHEVLPQIRRNGMYVSNELFSRLEREVSELREQVNEMHPLHVLGAIVLAQKGSLSFQSAAQFLSQHGFKTGQNRLFKYCRDKKLLCSQKGRQWNKPTRNAIDRGLLNLEVNNSFKNDTTIHLAFVVVIQTNIKIVPARLVASFGSVLVHSVQRLET